ncbi:hypothetical protein ATZ36_12055 [Candidatus Endomicrobiellum trichonymphae]|uniref:Phosphoribosylformylglycinamidine synthase n=1 Tax=Endomicrobium trichonymphae TaxID=1408204 RepID=A0A1E5IN82_ENDTX|nr:hypothetical protein ATZ36_12055 [Candidatus Endomicrobium trichonymphae]
MKKIKALILRAAGINCDCETQAAFELSGAIAERIHVNALIEKKDEILSMIFWFFPVDFLTATI